MAVQRSLLKAHVKGHIRRIEGKTVWVQPHERHLLSEGRPATLAERTRIEKGPKGHFLVAADADDAATIERHLKPFLVPRKGLRFPVPDAEVAAHAHAKLDAIEDAPEEIQGGLFDEPSPPEFPDNSPAPAEGIKQVPMRVGPLGIAEIPADEWTRLEAFGEIPDEDVGDNTHFLEWRTQEGRDAELARIEAWAYIHGKTQEPETEPSWGKGSAIPRKHFKEWMRRWMDYGLAELKVLHSLKDSFGARFPDKYRFTEEQIKSGVDRAAEDGGIKPPWPVEAPASEQGQVPEVKPEATKKLRNFGWDAVKLADLSYEELEELRKQVENDPASANPEHKAGKSIYLYTPKARKKLDALSWAVTYKLQQAKRDAEAPQEGQVNERGLVFRDGRWHRDHQDELPEELRDKDFTPEEVEALARISTGVHANIHNETEEIAARKASGIHGGIGHYEESHEEGWPSKFKSGSKLTAWADAHKKAAEAAGLVPGEVFQAWRNDEDGTEGTLSLGTVDGKYHAAMRDLDSGQMVGVVIFGSRITAAEWLESKMGEKAYQINPEAIWKLGDSDEKPEQAPWAPEDEAKVAKWNTMAQDWFQGWGKVNQERMETMLQSIPSKDWDLVASVAKHFNPFRVREVDAAVAAFRAQEAEAQAAMAKREEREKAKAPAGQRAKIAAKLRTVAQTKLEEAQEAINQPRNMNTARRARMGQGAIADAAKKEALAQSAMHLADAIEQGEAPALEKVGSWAGVETLDAALRGATWQHFKAKNPRGQREETPDPTPEAIEYAKLPELKLWADHTAGYARQLRNAGKEELAQALEALPPTEESPGRVFVYPSADLAEAIAKALGERDAWHIADAVKVRNRLAKFGITTDAELQAALGEHLRFREGAKGLDPIRKAELDLVGRKIPGYFPTPPDLAARLVNEAGIEPGMDVLEPSAGKGTLADLAEAAGGKVDAIEISSTLRALLEAKGHRLVGSDFTDFQPEDGKLYDRIVMNPPFEHGQDMAHIQRAYSLLKPGGRVVAIMSAGPMFRGDRAATAFRAWLDETGAVAEQLPEGSFKSSDNPTGVSTYMVTLDKPSAAVQAERNQYAALEAEQADRDVATGHHVGDLKTENGVTYRLNENYRWERVDQDGEGAAEGRVSYADGGYQPSLFDEPEPAPPPKPTAGPADGPRLVDDSPYNTEDNPPAALLEASISQARGFLRESLELTARAESGRLGQAKRDELRRAAAGASRHYEDTLAEIESNFEDGRRIAQEARESIERQLGVAPAPTPAPVIPSTEPDAPPMYPFTLEQEAAPAPAELEALPMDLPEAEVAGGDFEDVGEHIGGSKKDLAALRAALKGGKKLSLEDAEALEEDPAMATVLVTRENAVDRLAFVSGLRDDGASPATAFVVNKLLQLVAPKPADGPEARSLYLRGLNRVLEAMSTWRVPQDMKSGLRQFADESYGHWVPAELQDQKLELEAALEQAKGALKMAQTVAEGSIPRPVWRDFVAKFAHPKLGLTPKLKQFAEKKYSEASEERAAKVRALYENPAFKELEQAYTKASQAMTAFTSNLKKAVADHPENPQALLHALGEDFVGITRACSGWMSTWKDKYAGRAKAMLEKAAGYEKAQDWSWLEKPKRGEGQPGQPRERKVPQWTRIVPDVVERSGGRTVKFTSQALLDTFKFRGVEYGNWMDQGSSEGHTQSAGEALYDLADVLGIEPEHVSLHGRLALAFGARGGGRASAHYEPMTKAINLTKTRGGGSLAHEWGHALDNVIYMVSHGGAKGHVSFTTDSGGIELGPGVSQEVKDAFKAVNAAINYGSVHAKRRIVFNATVKSGFWSNARLDAKLDAHGRDPVKAFEAWAEENAPKPGSSASRWKDYRVSMGKVAAYLMWATKTEELSGLVPSSANNGLGETRYSATAREMGEYWSRPVELFARAWESYIEDELEARGMRNSYLVSGTRGRGVDSKGQAFALPDLESQGIESSPYPQGEERKAINEAMGRLVAALRADRALQKAIAILDNLEKPA